MKFNFYSQNDWRMHGVFQVLPCITLMYDDEPHSSSRMLTIQVALFGFSASVDILMGKPEKRKIFI